MSTKRTLSAAFLSWPRPSVRATGQSTRVALGRTEQFVAPTDCRAQDKRGAAAFIIHHSSFILLLTLLAVACTGTGRLKEGEHLYAGTKVKIHRDEGVPKSKQLKSDLKKAATLPRPNQKILWVRPKLSIYNTFHNRGGNNLGNFIADRFGQEPVLYNPKIDNRQHDLLVERAGNDGFFSVKIDSEEKMRRKTVRTRHDVYVHAPRAVITGVTYPKDSTLLGRTLAAHQQKSLVKVGNGYWLEDLIAERQRLADTLRNHGWYYFAPDHLLFEADTVRERGQLNLKLTVKKEVTERDRQRYRIGSITVRPDYDLARQSGRAPATRADSLARRHRDTLAVDECLRYVYRTLEVKPEVLSDQIFLRCGDWYSNDAYQSTIYRLLNLNLHKFINIRFSEPRSGGGDSLLDARILLTPYASQRVTGNLAGVFSPGYYHGARAGVAYEHRNAFHHAEALRLALNGAYVRTNEDNFDFKDFWLSDASAQITLPRFLWLRNPQSHAFNTTKFSLRHEGNWFKYDVEDYGRYGLSFQRIRGEAGYLWKKDRRGSAVQEVNPISVAMQYSTLTNKQLKNDLIAQIPTDTTGTLLFLLTFVEYQPNYTFTFDERLEPAKRRFTKYFRQRFSFQTSGYLHDRHLPDGYKLSSPLNFFTESDYRQYQRTNGRNILAARLAFSAGLPLKKDGFIALLDRYAVGGASSIRAFAPRSVGPGSVPRDTIDDASTGLTVGRYTGNVMIESSLEYRMPIGKYPELAVFADAGNVWLTSGPDASEASKFRFNRFYKELAFGIGAGIRVNLGFFVLRFDGAFPLAKPYLPEGQRWVGNELKFGSPGWRKENLNWNFSFGYPF